MKRRREMGFSLLELLVVVAIIGLLVGMAIPLLLDALDRSKQRATIAEMRTWGTALASYYSEKSIYPGTAGSDFASTIHADLVPYAVSSIHDKDAWVNPFWYQTDVNSSYTFQDPGKDNVVEDISSCNPVPVVCVSPQNWQLYNNDMALIDGVFVWAPN